MSIGLIGTKIGMTREFLKSGQSVPVTVIKVEKGRVLDVITKEKLASGSQYGNTTLSGQFIGLGVEKNMDNGLFVRVEGNVTQYQNIKLTNQLTGTDENRNTIDITNMDGATATISIGKSF